MHCASHHALYTRNMLTGTVAWMLLQWAWAACPSAAHPLPAAMAALQWVEVDAGAHMLLLWDISFLLGQCWIL